MASSKSHSTTRGVCRGWVDKFRFLREHLPWKRSPSHSHRVVWGCILSYAINSIGSSALVYCTGTLPPDDKWARSSASTTAAHGGSPPRQAEPCSICSFSSSMFVGRVGPDPAWVSQSLLATSENYSGWKKIYSSRPAQRQTIFF